MRTKFPKVSVIIPVKPDGEFGEALKTLREVDYPAELLEVFISYGFSPSRQRNMAAKVARGEILYFLDSDVLVPKNLFRKMVRGFSRVFPQKDLPQTRGFSLLPQWVSRAIVKSFFSHQIGSEEIGAIGGPNLWPKKEFFWPSIAGIILESFFAHYLMAARYRPIGPVHRADEKELILCNLAIPRQVFKKTGGFNETLYPNEENELLNRVEKLGYQIIYHPGLVVFRPHRESLGEICSQFFHYGRGRMEEIRVEGLAGNSIFLAPLIFFLYLLTLILYHPWWGFAPLLFYLGVGFFSALGFSVRKKQIFLALFLPFFFLLAHLSYAWGSLRGLMTSLEKRKRRQTRVKVVKVKEFMGDWDQGRI